MCIRDSVHIEEEPDRWVRAWWDEDMAANAGHVNKFSTGLQISTRNRIGVLSDVTLAFASSKINVHEISAREMCIRDRSRTDPRPQKRWKTR